METAQSDRDLDLLTADLLPFSERHPALRVHAGVKILCVAGTHVKEDRSAGVFVHKRGDRLAEALLVPAVDDGDDQCHRAGPKNTVLFAATEIAPEFAKI